MKSTKEKDILPESTPEEPVIFKSGRFYKLCREDGIYRNTLNPADILEASDAEM